MKVVACNVLMPYLDHYDEVGEMYVTVAVSLPETVEIPSWMHDDWGFGGAGEVSPIALALKVLKGEPLKDFQEKHDPSLVERHEYHGITFADIHAFIENIPSEIKAELLSIYHQYAMYDVVVNRQVPRMDDRDVLFDLHVNMSVLENIFTAALESSNSALFEKRRAV